ncbi:GNAT family N-acetyltransferase [uncultured Pseudoxanthomonas sp.]|uniref:GNAT family N-acetyltransferase n=1 Tax=uncultured Pseudoxanthomonas sp. TaxID=281701 RepID=UPI00261A40D3|nr:GNAT family N-acetyltransferase [uncultured Pseudoxanthomonas sp.]
MSPTLHPGQVVVETARLRLHAMSDADDDDAALMLALLNDAAFIRHIADRGVRTVDQARAYLRTGALRSYSENGFGMYAVRRKDTGALIGNCGLVLREGLEGPDLGYALLPSHAGQGFAREAANAVIADAARRLGLVRLHAIVNPDNVASIGLLQKLGFAFDRMILLPPIEHPVDLFHLSLSKEAA